MSRLLLRKIISMTLALAPLAVGSLGGCKSRIENDSRVKVVNGQVVKEGGWPAVIQIYNQISSTEAFGCTATWVSDRTVITAAHCVEGTDRSPTRVSIGKGTGSGLRALRVISHPSYRPRCGDCRDIAVIVFPKKSSSIYIPVALTQAQSGDPFTIIGFGKFRDGVDTDPKQKRQGVNVVRGIDYFGRVEFVGLKKPLSDDGTGQTVTNAEGDSGGPMIIRSRVQGVSSSKRDSDHEAGKLNGYYESVRTPSILDWLKNLTAQAKPGSNDVYILGITAGTENEKATDPTVNGESVEDSTVTPPNSDGGEVAPPAPQVDPDTPNSPDTPGTPDPEVNPDPPAPPPQDPNSGGSTLLDCNRDYGKIRQGGSGVCRNSSSGFCYRYSGGDVRYSQGQVTCSAQGGGTTPPSQPNAILDCNADYSKIRSGSSGICRNKSSGFCYRFSGGDVQYSRGRVSCAQ